MSQHTISRSRVMHRNAALGLLVALAVLVASPSFGQRSKTADTPKKPAAAKKASGRLPTYFASVVTQKQREEIYQLQADYQSQLDDLQAQMDALIAERDREIDAVLSAEQLAEVTKKREEAKKRRAERNSAKASETTATDG